MYDDYDQGYEGGRYQYSEYESAHTGDPNLDMEYENKYYAAVPDMVKKFIVYFHNFIKNRSVFELQNLYENTFPKLTDQFYDKTSWPGEAEILQIVPSPPITTPANINDPIDKKEQEDYNEHRVFIVLYKELYYRHIYARVSGGPSLEQRLGSFFNYCELLNHILSAVTPVKLVLHDQWLWELIDEFVYQFTSFAQCMSRVQKKTPADVKLLNANAKMWNVLCVLNVLHSFVDKSNIKRQLEVYASGGEPDSVAGDFGRYALYKMLGYFSLVGLLRLHSLHGDYYQAIKVLENIELHKKSQYSSVPACQISTSYYVGFAYMMMRRYSDAIRTFSSILLYIQRTKHNFQSRTYQNDQINKQTDQMYNLLAICIVLHPQCIDESIQTVLREKTYHEKIYKMQYGDMKEFESCFLLACPKFLISFSLPIDKQPSFIPPVTVDAPLVDYCKQATEHQLQVFLDEVRQQKMLPNIRSYLKLYTTLPLSKLANLMSQGSAGSDDELAREVEALRIHLLCFKHKMINVVWTKGISGLDGSFQSVSELDFYIDNDMIHIADTKVESRYGDFFLRKILKFEELNRKLHTVKI